MGLVCYCIVCIYVALLARSLLKRKKNNLKHFQQDFSQVKYRKMKKKRNQQPAFPVFSVTFSRNLSHKKGDMVVKVHRTSTNNESTLSLHAGKGNIYFNSLYIRLEFAFQV